MAVIRVQMKRVCVMERAGLSIRLTLWPGSKLFRLFGLSGSYL